MRRGLVTLALAVVFLLPLASWAQGAPSKAEPKQFTDASLERYWSCMERNDLQAIKELLWQHKNVERIDASIFGLPKDDFDDDSLLTIEERVWYRAERTKANNPLPDEGPIIYPHHLRETLDHLYIERGQRPNCAQTLEGLGLDGAVVAETLASGWSSDKDVVTDPTNARGEVHITVDRQNEARVFISSVQSQTSGETSMSSWRSTDWGATFTKGNIGNNSGSTWECDPCGYYQRSVNPSKLYESKIGCNTGSCTQTYVMMRVSSDNGATFADCTRPTTATASDRQMHVVDNIPTSPCYGNIYLTWHDSNTEKVVTSTAAQSCTAWGAVTSLSSASSAITPDVATGADGRVYVTWGNFGDSTFKIRGSSDCGVSWNSPAATTIKSYNGAWKNNIPAQCQRGVSTHPQVDVDRCPWSAYKGTVYVVMQDYNTTGTDLGCTPAYTNTRNYDLFFSKSTNNGTSWSAPVNLTAGEGSTVDDFHFMMRVDEMDGSIYIGWMRSRLNPTSLADRQTTSYVMMRSIDGGSTWSTVYTVSSQEGNERLSGMSTFERGDYESIDVYDGVVWPAWIDRRGATSTSPEHVITRKICTEPSHKSERAPTFTAPPTNVSAGASRVMNISWTAPDAFWGDGNENPSARKYQLYVDGVLAQDNILWTATSATWTAPDCSTSHAFKIRAINQCGVYKDYGTTSMTATGCCTNNPTNIAVNPAGPLTLCQGTAQTLTLTVTGGTGPFTYQWTQDGADIGGANSSTYSPNTTGTHTYNCRVTGSGCSTGALANTPTQITWQAAPTFAGISSVTNPASSTCTLALTWSAASTPCAGPITYRVYRSTASPVVTDGAHLVASGISATSYSDTTGLVSGTTYYYRVHAFDASNSQEDANAAELSGVPTGPIVTSTLTDTFEGALSGGGFDLAGWTHNFIGGTTNWAWSTARYNDGTHSWFAQDIASTSDMVLVSPPFGVGASTTLSFWHTYAFEGTTTTCYDGGTLEYSTNGTTWTVLPAADFTAGAYTGTANAGYSNPIGGKSAWCAGTVGTMKQVTANLGGDANLLNKTIQLRWHEGNDSSTAATGWYVDTVTIANAQTMGTCTTGSGCTAPGAPNLTSATAGCSGVSLAWNTVSGAASYNVYRGAATGGPYTKLGGMPVVTTSYTDSSAVAGTTYYYVVRAACDAGGAVESANSNERSATSLGTPAAPTGVSATGSCTGVSVSWSASSGATSYDVIRGTVCGTAVTTFAGVTSPYSDTSAVAGTTYQYWVVAKNACGSSANSSCASGTRTALPAAPAAPTFSSVSCTSLTVNWSAVSGATGYDVYRVAGATCTGAVKINVAVVAATSYPDSGLSAGTQYSYYIVAKNACGDSTNGSCGTTTTTVCTPNVVYSANSSWAVVPGMGNAGSILDPGESWDVVVTLANTGSAPATNVVASLTAAGTTFCTGTASFGTIPAGNSATATFRFTIDQAFTCLNNLSFNVVNKSSSEGSYANENGAFTRQVGTTGSVTPETGTAANFSASANTVATATLTPDFVTPAANASTAVATYTPTSNSNRITSPLLRCVTTNNTVALNPQAGNNVAVNTTVTAFYQANGPGTYRMEWTIGNRTVGLANISMTVTPSASPVCNNWTGANCIPSIPPEVAPGTSLSTAQTWTDKNTQTWPAASGALTYNIYYGLQADLPGLTSSAEDSCQHSLANPANTSDATFTEDPTGKAGGFYWYLITASNGTGEGTAGPFNTTGTPTARVVNLKSSGCPP